MIRRQLFSRAAPQLGASLLVAAGVVSYYTYRHHEDSESVTRQFSSPSYLGFSTGRQNLVGYFRIANLISVVSTMSMDYGYFLLFQGNTNSEYRNLMKELTFLQTKQEQDTLILMSDPGNPRVVELNNEIAATRERINNVCERIAFLKDAQAQKNDDIGGIRTVHTRCAIRLRKMCVANEGVYIKLGQHIAMLDHIVPPEYQTELLGLLVDNPRSSWESVKRVITEDLGQEPEALFAHIEREPIASASLAQVHVAYGHDGKKYAIKVQHEGLREGSVADMKAITAAIALASSLFDGFEYNWLAKEMNRNLPLELDFRNEAENITKCKLVLEKSINRGDVAVPDVIESLTSSRVLTMTFEEGYHVTDIVAIERMGMQRGDVSNAISRMFCEQMYRSGFVHCDPHEANLLVRAHPKRKNFPQLVLLDHGLYRELDPDFRRAYCRLWYAIVTGDEEGIKKQCIRMNAGPAYTLLAAVLTMRPWDDIVSSDIDRLKAKHTGGESEMLAAYGRKYFKDIVKLLAEVPSDMLLLLKTNDCLRHLDRKLETPVNTAVAILETTADVILREEIEEFISWASNVSSSSSPWHQGVYQVIKVARALSDWSAVMLRSLVLRVIGYVHSFRQLVLTSRKPLLLASHSLFAPFSDNNEN